MNQHTRQSLSIQETNYVNLEQISNLMADLEALFDSQETNDYSEVNCSIEFGLYANSSKPIIETKPKISKTTFKKNEFFFIDNDFSFSDIFQIPNEFFFEIDSDFSFSDVKCKKTNIALPNFLNLYINEDLSKSVEDDESDCLSSETIYADYIVGDHLITRRLFPQFARSKRIKTI